MNGWMDEWINILLGREAGQKWRAVMAPVCLASTATGAAVCKHQTRIILSVLPAASSLNNQSITFNSNQELGNSLNYQPTNQFIKSKIFVLIRSRTYYIVMPIMKTLISSVQFSSVQFSSVQFSSVQFSSVQFQWILNCST